MPADNDITIKLESFQRYLTYSSHAKQWGIEVTDLGFTRIPPNTPYPPFNHPESYTLHQKKGRILDQSQVIYITRGNGVFWTEASKQITVKAGSIMLLFPGIRHGYYPDSSTGWDEHWIGFRGKYAQSLMSNLFEINEPVIPIGLNPELLNIYLDCCASAQHEITGFRSIIGVKVLEILARAHAYQHSSMQAPFEHGAIISKACCQMSEAIESPFQSEVFARANGMSHTSFRRHFKTQTGLSPNQYLLELRLRKAQNLLTNTTLSVQTVASECGFDNAFYFSRFFKQRTGKAPIDYRIG